MPTERYNHTPYGERIIINGDQNYANTANDPDGAEWTVDTNGSDYGLVVGFQGLRFDGETSLYRIRSRLINSSTGVWCQRDFGHYVDGLNLNEIEKSGTTTRLDPTGFEAEDAKYVEKPRNVKSGPLKFLKMIPQISFAKKYKG